MKIDPIEILVTGGAGYIGSHVCVELIEQGYQPIIVDDLSNASDVAIQKVSEISGKEQIDFYNIDIRSRDLLRAVFLEHNIQFVLHFAGYKSIGDSVQRPLDYYDNNVGGTIALLQEMKKANVKNIVFSSSATVYGEAPLVPVSETHPVGKANNAYGQTKIDVENILMDLSKSDPQWNVGILRYFNPVGAHQSGLIGESANSIPSNLMPYISGVAIGKYEKLYVFGDDYPTRDGTGVRDFIHVVDLAKGHVATLKYLLSNSEEHNLFVVNLGTGKGTSVLEMVHAFEKINKCDVPYEIVERRKGDVAECWASVELANQELDWSAELGLEQMCRDAWKWQTMNPSGYS